LTEPRVLKLEVALNILSLLLLSASAFRDEERPYNVLVWLGERCKRLIHRVISGEAFEIVTDYNRWTLEIAIGLFLLCVGFTIWTIPVWGWYSENMIVFKEHADFSTPSGIATYIVSVGVATLFFVPALMAPGFVLMVIFGMAITWARAGGTKGKFVARIGLLAGLLGIVAHAFAA
jgi:hypothetical protein